ncbi:hypothetical protein PIB30_036057 [Stylosanthes scabra]|uniref:AB hydrolase-1 domain-containing protein n=1 Tax=Stylosanthes scabra TaxID=79078 RepID=A0ABU6QDS9_9FABA|nr:hypothetical protein [Stylosanthes scabra]
MEVASGVRSSLSFLTLQTHSPSHLQTLNNTSNLFFTSPKTRTRRSSCSLHYHAPASFHRASNFIINSSTSSSATTAEPAPASGAFSEVEMIKNKCLKWQWKGQYSINYFASSSDDDSSDNKGYPPLLLVHGFGASIPHWRRNIKTLSQNYTVYAIDLLGFGASDKPPGFSYTMETWAELILDFLEEVIKKPTVLIGNSVGSLACVIAASDSSKELVRGIVLLNCAGGMNNKAIVDDWRIKLVLPLLWLIDFLLKQRGIASAIFERVKQRYSVFSPSFA